MASTLEVIGESVKAFSRGVVSRRLGFMPSLAAGGGCFGEGSAGGMALVQAFSSSAGALDTELAAGDVLENSVVAACVNAIVQALPEAPILLERRISGGGFERVDSHPVLDLLHNPNPYLSEAELWGVTTAFERTRGEAFWYFECEEAGGVPKEIWFRAPQYVQILSDTSRFISGYNITAESGNVVALGEGDVVHFRHQLSASNPRSGWSPIRTGRRQIVGDNGAAAYHSAILRNSGAASLIISLKDAAAAGEVTPGQLDEYVQQFKRKVAGEGSGAILGMDLPLDIHKVGFSPDEMALEKLLEYYESRICALMGVNRRVINLGQDPTYENSRVALKDFWERTILPMRRRHAATLSSQLLPRFGLDPAQYRLRFDFSHIEALRDDVDGLHKRWRATFLAGGIDLYTFQEKIGLVPDEAYRGRYVKSSAALGAGEDEVKAVWEEEKHPRARDGRFGHSAGSARPLRTQRVSGDSGGESAGGSERERVRETAGAVREKLHREHGMERVAHGGEHENTLSAPFNSGREPEDIGPLIDYLPASRSQKMLPHEVRKQLEAISRGKSLEIMGKNLDRLEEQVREINIILKDPFPPVPLAPEESTKLQNQLAQVTRQLASQQRELKTTQWERYSQMWPLLFANDKPLFEESDFNIDHSLSKADRASISRGISFLSRMTTASPNPNGLKFKKHTEDRCTFRLIDSPKGRINEVLLASDSPVHPQSMVHEMGHWLAVNHPNLTEQLAWHHARRTEGDKVRPLSQIDTQYGPKEVFKRDKFIDAYMGKFYPSDNEYNQNEILSVGLQYFVLAPDVLAKDDPETFDFIYRLLRGESPEVEPKRYHRNQQQRVPYSRNRYQKGVSDDQD